MSWQSCPDPAPGNVNLADSIETVIVPRARDLGGFEVRRALPSRTRLMVGPFIFFDQMGPAEFGVGHGIYVRPHPHINLATVTYLFDGEIIHRDSLGTMMPIRPGAVNWMTAGRGIVHSERTSPELKARGSRLFGLQTWVALPAVHEETGPSFAPLRGSRPPCSRRGRQTRPCSRRPSLGPPFACRDVLRHDLRRHKIGTRRCAAIGYSPGGAHSLCGHGHREYRG